MTTSRCSFDDLRERYCRVRLTSLQGPLPDRLPFDQIVTCRQEGPQAVLILKEASEKTVQEKAKTLHCQAEILPLCLEELYKSEVA